MKVKFLDNLSYQTYPETDDMIEIDEEILQQIGRTKQFVDGKIVDYDGLIKQKRRTAIKNRLNELNQDFVQVLCGAVIDDIEERRQEFIALHNELRILLGKEPRKYTNKEIEEEQENVTK